jgi:hypothetical protein
MKRRTLHDEEHNEDFFYESVNGRVWHKVEPEEEEREEEEEDDDNVGVVLLEKPLSTAAPVRVENPSDDIHAER